MDGQSQGSGVTEYNCRCLKVLRSNIQQRNKGGLRLILLSSHVIFHVLKQNGCFGFRGLRSTGNFVVAVTQLCYKVAED